MENRYIYMDNAATAGQRPDAVAEAVIWQMRHSGNAGRGSHGASLKASGVVYDTRKKLSALFHAEGPERISFTANATDSLNLAIKGCLKSGDHVITTVMEHNSVLRPLYEMQERGVALTIAACDALGNLDWQALESAVTPKSKAIVCTHASNLTGNAIDLERMNAFVKKHKLLWILDASQTAGSMDIDVSKYEISILCFTGHKGLMGPQGTGGIYVRPGVEIQAQKSGGSGFDSFNKRHPEIMPEALEAGTLNIHGLAGLSAALDYILTTGVEVIHEKEIRLMRRFMKGIEAIEGVRLYGDYHSDERAPIVALNIGDADSSEISDLLDQEFHICTRPGAHCAPLMHKALGTEIQGAVRFSFSVFNTEEEIDEAISAIKEIAEG